MRDDGSSDVLLQLLPITILWLIFAVLGYFIAKRKGISTLRFVICILPPWGMFFMWWWVSLTDKDVLSRLERLEKGL